MCRVLALRTQSLTMEVSARRDTLTYDLFPLPNDSSLTWVPI
jgi:hypothetical protein